MFIKGHYQENEKTTTEWDRYFQIIPEDCLIISTYKELSKTQQKY